MTVVGVAAAGFRGIDWGEVPSLWIPTMMKKQATPEFDWLDDRRGRWLHVFGRLKPGRSARPGAGRPAALVQGDARGRHAARGLAAGDRRAAAQFLASTLDVLPAAQGRSDLRGGWSGRSWSSWRRPAWCCCSPA